LTAALTIHAMTDELDPKALATARKHGRLLRRRTIRNRVIAGVGALFVAIAAVLGYSDLSGPPLGTTPATAQTSSVPVQSDSGSQVIYSEDGESEDYGDIEEGEYDDEGGIVTAPVTTPAPVVAPAPVVTQQS
jgi:hypothetical protein